MALYGYVRVSTTRQAEEGVSLYAQETMIRGMAMLQRSDPDAVRFFREEGVSGSTHLENRPAGSALLAALRKGDAVLVTRLDRLFRSAYDALKTLEALQREGVRVIFGDIGDTDSTNGKLMLTILAGVAEAERNIIRERIRIVKRTQNNKGRYLGGAVPFGYEVREGALVLTPEGAKARAKIVQLRAKGLSLRKIVEAMAKGGVVLSHTAVRAVMATDMDAGKPAA